jgi:hypothetical protein
MTRYTVTYVQEAVQPVDGESIEAVAVYANRLASERKMRVLSIYRTAPPVPLQPPAAA